MKKKNFVCIFAHPDDEAFGPSGTIHLLTKKYNVYILCATRGQMGQDSDLQDTKLSQRRSAELLDSAKTLGVKKVYFLGFRDGTLSNNLYHKLAAKIQKHLENLKPEKIMTYGPTGISGHIDHITMHYVTMFVFQKLPFVQEVWSTITIREKSDLRKDYFVYFPPGSKRSEIDKIVDVTDVWDTKVAAMKCHKSQKHDYERILKDSEKHPKEEYFLVKKK